MTDNQRINNGVFQTIWCSSMATLYLVITGETIHNDIYFLVPVCILAAGIMYYLAWGIAKSTLRLAQARSKLDGFREAQNIYNEKEA